MSTAVLTSQSADQMNVTDAGGVTVTCNGIWKIFGPKPKALLANESNSRLRAEHTVAVRDLSLEIDAGETFVIMGLSGSGKSTLIRCLTRLIEPTSGEITIDGRSVTSMDRTSLRELRRQDCAMVFQHFGLLGHKTVLANAAYGLEVRGVKRPEREARAMDVLKLVGLSGWEERYPDQLSGGMKQRVGLARALAMNPKVLLLDEPFSALDPLIRRELQDELLTLARTVKKTLIFITHDMSEALKLGDRIAIMRQGELVQVGTPEDILLNPADDYVRKFTEDTSRARFVRAHAVSTPLRSIAAESTSSDALSQLWPSEAGATVANEGDSGPRVALREDLRRAADGATVADVATPATVISADARLVDLARRMLDSDEPLLVRDPTEDFFRLVDTRRVLAVFAEIKAPTGRAEQAE